MVVLKAVVRLPAGVVEGSKMTAKLHPAEKYAHDVISGKVVACS